MKYYIAKPESFDFKTTIYSHGWCDLKPFLFDEDSMSFSYVFSDLGFKKPVSVKVSATDKNIKIDSIDKKLTERVKKTLLKKIEHMLRLNEEFTEFYQLTDDTNGFSWISKKKVGRLVRSPTVFEDLIKTVCTTNCSWGMTKAMVANLVKKLGDTSPDGEKSFPTAEAMADVDEDFYRMEMRAGYRSPYFVEISQTVAAGEIAPEDWLTSDLSTHELKKEIKNLKGVGDYAAENLLKLLGRYDGLALDSALRSGFYKKHNNGKTCSDKTIERFYRKFGEWRGLAIWLDMSEQFLN